ncbi:MAG: Rieske (2Fe-2S) protein [Ardenticatenaceae bacterium]|nr:Rieske (2Fe-2S) protein [Ardenticatenaceae bacterium]
MNDAPQSPEREQTISRRRLLTLAVHGGWVAAMGVLVYQIGRFLGTEGLASGPSPLVKAGTLADFPPDTTTYVPEARAWVHRSAEELTALDAVCPHLGCLVQQNGPDGGFRCPCHGSEFGNKGELQRGPAERPLRQLDIQTQADNTVTIRTS